MTGSCDLKTESHLVVISSLYKCHESASGLCDDFSWHASSMPMTVRSLNIQATISHKVVLIGVTQVFKQGFNKYYFKLNKQSAFLAKTQYFTAIKGGNPMQQ